MIFFKRNNKDTDKEYDELSFDCKSIYTDCSESDKETMIIEEEIVTPFSDLWSINSKSSMYNNYDKDLIEDKEEISDEEGQEETSDDEEEKLYEMLLECYDY